MVNDLLLASSSSIRKQLFEKANVSVKCVKPNVDEESVKASLLMEKYKARDIADALAELKATKVSSMNPANLVIGCDQILELEGSILRKPASKEKAIDQILTMSGKKHVAYSGAVICENGKPVWRFVGKAELYSNHYKEDYVTKYVNRNWESIKESVGGYKIEEEGSRLFSKITGDFFSILGFCDSVLWGRREKVSHVTVSAVLGRREKVSLVTVSVNFGIWEFGKC